ncbi:3-carboxy-cis,cis-muconate cycloisomerase [Leminorella richardii]|uniref:3-carboxy-cis,cis-muconate cycloisomerase n=1 Tax=Leminorella richardii TaxID=158841 RepID=A0A2X4UYN8_9GAMM|nr:adenylosuccinate lyase [Leminorella richardii]SQI43941.1 3-carboxy-cis,cis-muconate cycloisomerase [Leminorella richardii]
MNSTVIDSQVFGALFSTKEMRDIFSDRNLVQKWLDTEAALAKAEGELGIIPKEAMQEICSKANADLLDIPSIGEFYKSSITIVPLLKAFKAVLNNNAGEFVHWGATSQDIVDTGLVLQIREAHAVLLKKVRQCEEACYGLAEKYRDVVMAGRTHVQHALPITMGFKAAGWASEFARHTERLNEITPRLFVGQFSGAVGTLASLETEGLKVQERMMKELGLAAPDIAWHSARDNIAEFISVLALVAGTIGKVTREVLTLQRTEIGELEEPFFMGKVGSSTMPHKRNPQVCENVIALTRSVRALAPLAVEAMNCENERDWSCEIAEWDFVQRACHLLDAALEKSVDILENLIVYPEKMEKNLSCLKGLMLSESVMMHLGAKMGRLTAHEIVYTICMDAFEKGIAMEDALMSHPEVMQFFSKQEIKDMLNPHNYIGLATTFVDRVLAKRPSVK